MDVAVTGANGFLGTHLVDLLLQQGHRVRCLFRSVPPTSFTGLSALEAFGGDVRSPNTLAPFLAGAEALFHVAAANTPLLNRDQEIFSCNVEGTRNVLAAAKAAKISKLVFTSSVVARGRPADGAPTTETTPFNLWSVSGPYERSKHLSEMLALDYFRKEGVPVVVVAPSTCLGPGDAKPTFAGRLILDFVRGRLPAYVDVLQNFADVRDVARGHLQALESGVPGEVYLLCGSQNVLLSGLFAELTNLTGVCPPRLKLPMAAALPLAHALHLIWRVTGKEPPLRRSSVERGRLAIHYDNTRTRSQLGFVCRPLADSLADELHWFVEHGYLASSDIKRAGESS